MRIALPPRLATAGTVLGACLCLFGFGFLAGLTLNAPWGAGPAAVCATAAAILAIPPLAWLRRRGAEAAGGEGPAWLARLDPPLAYGVAVALAMAATALLLLSRSWSAASLFWPACFALASAGLTVFGDARARAESDLNADEDDEAEEAYDDEDATDDPAEDAGPHPAHAVAAPFPA